MSAVSLAALSGVPPRSRRCQWGKTTALVPNSPQLRSSSRSGSVNQPLARRNRLRFYLASGLLFRAMDAALIAARSGVTHRMQFLAETKDGSSGARRGGRFGSTLPHSGFDPENGQSPVPKQRCRPRAGSRQRDRAVDSHSFRERYQTEHVMESITAISRGRMLEHYSHVRIDAKRKALDQLDAMHAAERPPSTEVTLRESEALPVTACGTSQSTSQSTTMCIGVFP